MQNYHIIFIIFTLFTNWFIKSICIIGLTAIITLISLPIFSQNQNQNQDQYRTVENNLVAALKETGEFDNLLAEMELAGLTEQLEKEQFTTLLAFRDDAFNSLSADIFDKFSQPENRIKVLKYHLIKQKVTQQDLRNGEIATAQGSMITFSWLMYMDF